MTISDAGETGGSTLAEESMADVTHSSKALVECASDAHIHDLRTQRRGRLRSKSSIVDGKRSRSVSKSWNNKRVTFLWKDPKKFKAGINKKEARNRRALTRCTSNNNLRKKKLKELRQSLSLSNKNCQSITGDNPFNLDKQCTVDRKAQLSLQR